MGNPLNAQALSSLSKQRWVSLVVLVLATCFVLVWCGVQYAGDDGQWLICCGGIGRLVRWLGEVDRMVGLRPWVGKVWGLRG